MPSAIFDNHDVAESVPASRRAKVLCSVEVSGVGMLARPDLLSDSDRGNQVHADAARFLGYG